MFYDHSNLMLRVVVKQWFYCIAGLEIRGWIGQYGKLRSFVGTSIVKKTGAILTKESDVVVCLPESIITHVTERMGQVMTLVREGPDSYR